MRAGQITAYRRVELVEAPAPAVPDGQVLVRLRVVALCGSDLRQFARRLPPSVYPLPVGFPTHECAGVVEQSRSAEFRVGQRVIALPTQGRGLSEYVVEPPGNLVPLPDSGELDQWVMCQHVGTVLCACSRIGSVIGKRVVVLGQGGIGLAFTRLLVGAGARELIATDLLASRLAVARDFGATATVDAAREDVVERIASLTDGEGADVVIAATGEPAVVEQAVRIVRHLGLVDFFGSRGDEWLPFPYDLAYDKNITCIFTVAARLGDTRRWGVAEAVRLVSQGRLDLSSLISHRFRFEDVQAAHELVADRKDGVLKAVIEL